MTTVAELRIDVDVNDRGSDAKLRRTERAAERLENSAEGVSRSTDRAGRNIRQMGNRAQRSTRQMGSLKRASDGLARSVGTAAGAFAGLAGAAAIFGTIRIGSGFEEQMSAVLAITGATQDEFEGLSATARELGATTVFSAKQAAEGMEFLARAGFDANEIMGALPGTLNLAAAGALDLGRAADIASNVLTGFGLATSDANRVADVLAKAAASSNTNVEQLGEAMKFVAPVAAGLGVSLETATAAVGKLSDAGLQASVAGTGLRRVLSELAAPSQRLTELLGGTSLEVDGFEAVMKQLASQSISTGEALEIFGDRGGPAFAVLSEQFKQLDKQGVSSLENLAKSLQAASGFAEKTAETMTDNFAGAVKQARSALEELFITAAVDSGALDALTGAVESLTNALRSDAAKEFAIGFGQGIQDATNFVIGLIAVLERVEEKTGSIVALFTKLEGFTPFGKAGQLARDGIGSAGSALIDLGETEQKLKDQNRAIEEVRIEQAEAVDAILKDRKRLLEEVEPGRTQFDLIAEAGPQVLVDAESIKSVDQLTGFLDAAAKAATGAADAADDFAGATGRAGDSAAQTTLALLKQELALAERVNEAASIGGQASVDLVQDAIEIERLTDDLFQKAQRAGESVTKAQIQNLVEQIDASEKATDKLLETDEKLRQRVSDLRNEIGDTLDDQINSFIDSVQDIDITSLDVFGDFGQISQQFARLKEEFDIGSIGVDADELAALEKAFSQGANEFEKAIRDAAALGLNVRIPKVLAEVKGLDTLERTLQDFGDAIAKDIDRDTKRRLEAEGLSSEGVGFGENLRDIARVQAEALLSEQGDRSDRSLRREFNRFLDQLERQSQGLIENGIATEGELKSFFDDLRGDFKQAVKSGAYEGSRDGTKEANQDSGGLFDTQNIANLGGAIGGVADAVTSLERGILAFQDPNASTFDKITGAVEAGGRALGRAFQQVSQLIPALGPVGVIAGAVGEVAGLVSSVASFFKNIINPSDLTAQGVFQPGTGKIGGLAQDNGAEENAQARDQLIDSILNITERLVQITGGFVGNDPSTPANEAFLNVAVRRSGIDVGFQGANGEPTGGGRFDLTAQGATDALNKAIELTVSAINGGNRELVDFAQSALEAGQSVEDMIEVLDALGTAFETGQDSIIEFARRASETGIGAEVIVDGIRALEAAFAFTVEPLSETQQALKDLEDAIDPAIQALRSVGLSIQELTEISNTAARGIGESFLDDLRDVALAATNDVVASYAELLKQVGQQNRDAVALFERGAITQSELGFVQSVGGLQASNFFESLSDADRDSLGDFLGVLRITTGDIAVARVELEEQFGFLIDNVEETVKGFEDAARVFQRLADSLDTTADRIRAEFVETNPLETTQDLSGQLNQLRSEALAGSERALGAIPAIADSLVQAARQAFGGTDDFAKLRDFALSVLDETASFAQEQADKNLQDAENAKSDVDLLREIRGLLADDRQIGTLQGILDEGKLTNKLIEEQLRSFVDLFNADGSAANPITNQELQDALNQYLSGFVEIPSNIGLPELPDGVRFVTTSPEVAQVINQNTAAVNGINVSLGAINTALGEINTTLAGIGEFQGIDFEPQETTQNIATLTNNSIATLDAVTNVNSSILLLKDGFLQSISQNRSILVDIRGSSDASVNLLSTIANNTSDIAGGAVLENVIEISAANVIARLTEINASIIDGTAQNSSRLDQIISSGGGFGSIGGLSVNVNQRTSGSGVSEVLIQIGAGIDQVTESATESLTKVAESILKETSANDNSAAEQIATDAQQALQEQQIAQPVRRTQQSETSPTQRQGNQTDQVAFQAVAQALSDLAVEQSRNTQAVNQVSRTMEDLATEIRRDRVAKVA